MNINIKDNVTETTVRKIDIEIADIPLGTDKLELAGDILYIIGSHPEVDDLYIRLFGNYEWSGEVVLADGDGYKIIQSRGIYTSKTRYYTASYAFVAGEHRFYPGLDGLWGNNVVGLRAYMVNPLLPPPGEVDFRISSIGEDINGKYFVFYDYINGPLGPNIEFWFEEDIFTTEYFTTSIKLVTSTPSAIVKPDSTIDVSGYWSLIRTVWDNLETEDRELIEEVWQGFTEEAGNLLQRLYEIELSGSVKDILVHRKSNWAFVNSRYRKYNFSTGYTDRNMPTHFFDTTLAPFKQSQGELDEVDDFNSYLSIEGKFYKIKNVISASEIEVENANFDTRKSLSYSIGGVDIDDIVIYKLSYASLIGFFNVGEIINGSSGASGFYIKHDSKYLYLSYVKQMFLAGETISGEKGSFVLNSPLIQEAIYPNNIPDMVRSVVKRAFFTNNIFYDLGIKDIYYAEVLSGTALVRYKQTEYNYGYVRAITPTYFYSSKPIFNRSYRGTWIKVNGTNYRIEDIASDGSYAVLTGASFLSDTNNVIFSVPPYDFSEWIDGVTDGTTLFIGSLSEDVFYPDYVGREIFIGGINNDFFTIVSYVDSKTVVLNKAAAADTDVIWQLSVDVIVDLEDGQVIRASNSYIKKDSFVDVRCFIKTKYFININGDVAEIPTLQETVRNPDNDSEDILSIVASSYETYLGHKNIEELNIDNKRGVRLTPYVDYVSDNENGEIIFYNNSVVPFENFQATMRYSPYYGKEEDDYFIEDGILYFRENPGNNLWAESVFTNNEDPYNKYGKLISFYQENSSAYHLALLSLWITYWNGPRPKYLERGLNILLGLPYAEDIGVVEYVSLRRIGMEDIWVVTILYDNNIRVEHELPGGLTPYVVAGETVNQFDILAGFSERYFYSGNTLNISGKKTVVDDINSPFIEKVAGGKIVIENGLNEGVFQIVTRKDSSRIILDKELLEDDAFTYTVKTPAIRIFDQTNYENFLNEINWNSLQKYFTENTTVAEKELAKVLLRRHLFLCQSTPEAFSALPAVSDILSFVRNIKPQYTDFIFQVLIEEDEEFETVDSEIDFDFKLNLTSTFSWWAGLLRSGIDPFTGSTIPHTYPSYIDGLVVGNIFSDTTNSPFTIDDVGRYIWIDTAFRYYQGGSISSGDNVFNGPINTFSANDVGKYIHIPSLGLLSPVKIIEFIATTSVRVSKSFSLSAVGLEFHVSHEIHQGVYEIVAFIGATQVQIDTVLVPGGNMHYSIIDNSELLDEEAVALVACGQIEVYDALMNLIEVVSLDSCPP